MVLTSDSAISRHLLSSERRSPSLRPLARLLVVVLCGYVLCGCASAPTPSLPEDVARFEQAGPYRPTVDRKAIVAAKLASGPYRVTPGDILQFEMPVVMRALSPEAGFGAQAPKSHVCRVSATGTLTLPTVGEIEAAGKSLEEIEAAAVAAYHPRYTVRRPAIVATVRERSMVKVSVTGAVMTPGIHALTSDERSLVGALMKAGGIVKEGAAAIRIFQPGDTNASKPVALPVEGLNLAFTDVALHGGEVIEVLRLDPQVLTVVGLVNHPGTYPYPAGVRYNLMHALGLGGGMEIASRPRYVQVLRQDADGQIVSAVFDLDTGYEQAAALAIKQGDVVAVVETPATQFNRFLSGMAQGASYHISQFTLQNYMQNTRN